LSLLNYQLLRGQEANPLGAHLTAAQNLTQDQVHSVDIGVPATHRHSGELTKALSSTRLHVREKAGKLL